MKLNIKTARTWIGWETFLAISLYGSSLRALPISYETSWAITFGSFIIATMWFFLDVLKGNIIFGKKKSIYLIFFLIFISYMLISFFWSPIKLSDLVISDIFILTIFFIPTIVLLIGTNNNTENRWLTGVIIACGSLSFYVFITWLNASTTLYLIFSSQSLDNSLYTSDVYLGVSQSVITISIIAFVFSIYYTERKYIFFAIVLITLWLAMELGGRGPIIWAIASILSLGITRLFQQKNLTTILKRLFFFSTIVIITLPIIFYLITSYDLVDRLEFINRFIGDSERSYDSSSSIGARIDLKDQALSFISENPIIGYGALSFRVITGSLYSHNIFLDILFDLGLLGLILLILILTKGFTTYWKILKNERNPVTITIASLFLFTVGMNLTSGYFYWSPFMVWLSLIVVFNRKSTKASI